MRKPAFAKLSSTVLESYKKDIEKELASRSKVNRKRDKVLAKVTNILKSEGMTFDDLASAKTPRSRTKTTAASKPRAKVAPKYRNPKNASEVWTGRGRQPRWVAEFIKGGGKIERLLIKK